MSRALFENPNDMAICQSWLTTANEVDAIFEMLDPEEQQILEDLGEILRTADGMLRRPQN